MVALLDFFNKKNTQKKTTKVLIIGAGEVGYHIAKRLSLEHKDVVLIDQDPEILNRIEESLDIMTLLGSGSNPRLLVEAEVAKSDIIMAVTNSDETNLVACMFAGALAPDALTLVRIRDENYLEYKSVFIGKDGLHVDKVINPDNEVVSAANRFLSMPQAADFKEFLDGKIKLATIPIKDGPLVGSTLMEFPAIANDTHVRVAAIIRDKKVIIPSGQDVIKVGDLVTFIYTQDSLETVRRITATNEKIIKNILIIGGGNIGALLAKKLEKQNYHVRLMDKDPARCQVLATQLQETVVLLADGTREDVLHEENVANMDVVIALTGNEETNVLVCLLARSLGASYTVTRVNKSAYLPLARAMGIDHCLSPRLAAVNTILKYVRKGRVLASFAIEGDEAEVLEAETVADSTLVGAPLKSIDINGASVLAVVREEQVLIPNGDTVLQANDKVLIIALRPSVSEVEAALMVKLHSL